MTTMMMMMMMMMMIKHTTAAFRCIRKYEKRFFNQVLLLYLLTLSFFLPAISLPSFYSFSCPVTLIPFVPLFILLGLFLLFLCSQHRLFQSCLV
jgi:predicted membrane metal-binding protein